MKKIKNRHYIVIIVVALAIMLIPKGMDNLFGSTTDWLSQHSAFPEYFRNLFYQTGKLIPNFAFHLGGGQNIFNFAYYGFLNPIILISYLLPFIKMGTYLQLSNMILVIASGLLFYNWIRGYHKEKLSLVLTLLFITTGPLIFHFHRQVMFVNYMPFLIMGLIGIDRYFKTGSKWLYALSVFLIILSSYFFSIGCIMTMVLYGIFVYLKTTKNITFKDFMCQGFKFVLPIFAGILMACVLLLPVAYTLSASRNGISESIELLFLFIPDLNLNRLLYGTYCIGVTAITLLALLMNTLEKKKQNIFLNVILIVMVLLPVFIYLLNGTLYIRQKVLIPIIPLLILNLGIFLETLAKRKYTLLKISSGILILTVLLMNKATVLSYIDIILTGILLVLYIRTKKENILYIGIVTLSSLICLGAGVTDEYIEKDKYQAINSGEASDLFKEVLETEPSIVRSNNLTETSETVNRTYNSRYYQTSFYSSTFNSEYKNFYDNIFKNAIPYRNKLITAQTSNVMFDTFMGVKYIVNKENPGFGYEQIDQKGTYKLYKNDHVLPIGYATNNVIGEKQFDQIKYPYNTESLLNEVVVKTAKESTFKSQIKPLAFQYEANVGKGIILEKKGETSFVVDAIDKESIKLKLNGEDLSNKILFVKFKLTNNPSCSKGDLRIRINDVTNKLTCRQWMYHNNNFNFEYVLSNITDNTLNLHFSKGKYRIKSIELYTLDKSAIKNVSSKVDEFVIDKEQTLGDNITGSIEVSNDGYFVTSIPYDKGFKVTVNGKKQKVEKVNKAFIGFPIKKGPAEITITYEAPYATAGKIISLIGILIFAYYIYEDKKRNRLKKD